MTKKEGEPPFLKGGEGGVKRGRDSRIVGAGGGIGEENFDWETIS